MAIDYGRKRCGVAVTDPLRISANGLPTVRTCDLLNFVMDYREREGVDILVIGLPKNVRGEDSESEKYIREFLNRLAKKLPELPVERYDERFTSVIAHRAMIEGGLSKSRRREKELADKTAAVIILTDWLNYKNVRF